MTPDPHGLGADVVVVGAGPAGSSAAAWAARSGLDVLVIDAAQFPRDKACGDGLTPRAIKEMRRLGMGDFLAGRPVNWGLHAAGFGRAWHLPWPGGSFPAQGSAVPRTELDHAILQVAIESGARTLMPARAVDVRFDAAGRLDAVIVATPEGRFAVRGRHFVIADGARSQLGRKLGREWHRDTAYGVAIRGYVDSGRADDPWITSHVQLRDEEGTTLSGYGWIFPLGNGQMNIGVGTLATAKRPADLNLRQLLGHYHRLRRGDYDLGPTVRVPKSALLPMGGAVSGVAGPNWMFVGDAAGCVNPLNGEGIDYGLETGRFAAELLAAGPPATEGLQDSWPRLLRAEYGRTFSAARRAAGLLSVPGFLPSAGPLGMRSRGMMKVVMRVMANLVTEEDTDFIARSWRWTGNLSSRLDQRPPFS